MGDHHDRLAELVDAVPQEAQHLGAGAAVEVAGRLVGEDDLGPADQRAGDGDPLLLPAGQLATAGGRGGPRRPTVSTTVSSHSWSGFRPAMSSGSVMFSSAVSVGSRLNAWKMKPTRVAAQRGQRACRSSVVTVRCRRSRPRPRSARSRPARQCINVDLPDPDGPMIAVNWPRSDVARSRRPGRRPGCRPSRTPSSGPRCVPRRGGGGRLLGRDGGAHVGSLRLRARPAPSGVVPATLVIGAAARHGLAGRDVHLFVRVAARSCPSGQPSGQGSEADRGTDRLDARGPGEHS